MDALERFVDHEALICTVLCYMGASLFACSILLVHQINDWLYEKKPSRWLEDMGWAIITGSTFALLVTAARSLLK